MASSSTLCACLDSLPPWVHSTAHTLGWLLLGLISVIVVVALVRRVLYSGYVSIVRKDGSRRHVLITGCDTGFGNGLAHRLHQHGFFVFAACLTQEAADAFNDIDDTIVGLVMNVCDDKQVEEAVEVVNEYTDSLWAVVNNAGINAGFLVEWTPVSIFEKVMAVNYFGGVRVSRAFLRHVQNARGRFVNVCSAAGLIAGPSMGPYNGSKFAFEAFSDTMRREMADWGVNVSIIEPGFFATPLVKQSAAVMRKFVMEDSPQELRDRYGKHWIESRLKRVGVISRNGANPIAVVNTMEEAITAAYPAARYKVGWDCRLLYGPLSLLPAGFVDAFTALLFSGAGKPRAARKAKTKAE